MKIRTANARRKRKAWAYAMQFRRYTPKPHRRSGPHSDSLQAIYRSDGGPPGLTGHVDSVSRLTFTETLA